MKKHLLTQDQTQTQHPKIDPKIIMASSMLRLSGMELQQAIEQELAENPALELVDEDPCSDCELKPFGCRSCQHNGQEVPAFASGESDNREPDIIFDFTADSDDQSDPIGRIQCEIELPEHLRIQLRNAASGRIHQIGDYLINYITESGYLKCDPLEVALELAASEEEIAEAVSVIQTLDPPGVGARDLHECMLIQLRYLAEDGTGNPTAETIVRDLWDEMKARRFDKIARRMRIKPDQVKQAVEFIRTRLNPYPAASFRSPWDSKASDTTNAVRPDVVIRRTPVGYEVEIVANERLSLAVNAHYRQVYDSLRNRWADKLSPQDRKHITEYVERADLFIRNLTQRRKTLRNITKCIIEYQHGFLDTGSKLFLRPLTRVKVAGLLHMHESTVSRAIASKYVQLPSQEVVPFDFFFRSSLSVMDIIGQMIAQEDPSHPLSDQAIADILTKQDHQVARRTVAKYREAQKILSSRQRRR